jgi:hypothetical protein
MIPNRYDHDMASHEVRFSRTLSVAAILIGALAVPLYAQELNPAAYTPAPIGVNVVTVTSTYNRGDLAFDPSGPIDEASASITASTVAYYRTLNVAGRSANLGLILPYVFGDLEGLYLGQPAAVYRSGFGDANLRLAVNLYGAPAMTPKEFQSYRPRTLIGASLIVGGPTGQYDSTKLINIGTNRWAFKPEIGVVHVMGRWAVDAYIGGWFFTDNTDFAGGLTRAQNPILSTQAHVRRAFSHKVWAALDANFWWGGQTSFDGSPNDDRQQNSRVGLTFAFRLGNGHSVRVAASSGAFTRIGGDFDSIGLAYSYSWLGKP